MKKSKAIKTKSLPTAESHSSLIDIAQRDIEGVLQLFDTTLEGLSELEAQHGFNWNPGPVAQCQSRPGLSAAHIQVASAPPEPTMSRLSRHRDRDSG